MTLHKLGEASRRRFQIFTWGSVAHEDGDFLVDGQFFEDHKAYLAARAADGYYVPIWRKHTDEGISYGLLLDLIATEAGIDAVVEFAGGWEKAFDDGHLPHWSPSFYTGWTDSTGQTWARAMRELSFVGVPHMKQVPVAGTFYALSEGLARREEVKRMDDELIVVPVPDAGDEESEPVDQELAEPPYEMGDVKRDMGEVRSLLQRLMELMGAGKDEEPAAMADAPDEEKPEELALAEQVRALKAELKQLRESKARTEIRAALPKADEAKVKRLVALSEADEGVYRDTLKMLSEAAAAGGKQAPTPTTTPERGQQGSAAATGTPTLKQLCEQAKRESVTPGLPLTKYLSTKGVDWHSVSEDEYKQAKAAVWG